MKLLSVAIPSYNSQAYMRHAIESLLTGGEEMEILIVNDGSKDDTAAIADEYAAIYGLPSDEAISKIEGIMEKEEKKQAAKDKDKEKASEAVKQKSTSFDDADDEDEDGEEDE